jgi:hypothetical protein
MFIHVLGYSLVVVGVPVNFPVKPHRMIWREDLNSQPLVCLCLLLLSVRLNWVLIACTCVLFFAWTCWRCYIVATWRGFGIWEVLLLYRCRFLVK